MYRFSWWFIVGYGYSTVSKYLPNLVSTIVAHPWAISYLFFILLFFFFNIYFVVNIQFRKRWYYIYYIVMTPFLSVSYSSKDLIWHRLFGEQISLTTHKYILYIDIYIYIYDTRNKLCTPDDTDSRQYYPANVPHVFAHSESHYKYDRLACRGIRFADVRIWGKYLPNIKTLFTLWPPLPHSLKYRWNAFRQKRHCQTKLSTALHRVQNSKRYAPCTREYSWHFYNSFTNTYFKKWN